MAFHFHQIQKHRLLTNVQLRYETKCLGSSRYLLHTPLLLFVCLGRCMLMFTRTLIKHPSLIRNQFIVRAAEMGYGSLYLIQDSYCYLASINVKMGLQLLRQALEPRTSVVSNPRIALISCFGRSSHRPIGTKARLNRRNGLQAAS